MAAGALAQTEAGSTASNIDWTFGGFLDVGYSNSFNSPSNHLFRSRGTTPRVDDVTVNMAGGYLRKRPTAASRWGVEATAHAGEDARVFGFSATEPNVRGASWLRHLGPTSLSYLAPVGSGLSLQGGIFTSVIGYDSLYAKDNFTYTRPWTADFTPYLMLGVNAAYTPSKRLTTTAFVVNGYWHLAHANDVPSFGGQVAYRATELVTVKQTVFYGPHQSNTSFRYWRFLSDTIVERRATRVIAAAEFQVSAEVVDAVNRPTALWMAAQAPIRWTVRGPWSITIRPEVAWDRQGRWTAADQLVGALTSAVEYRAASTRSQGIVRVEHRYDRSTGDGGGFFKDIQPGIVGLTPAQHLLVVGWILTFDAR